MTTLTVKIDPPGSGQVEVTGYGTVTNTSIFTKDGSQYTNIQGAALATEAAQNAAIKQEAVILEKLIRFIARGIQ